MDEIDGTAARRRGGLITLPLRLVGKLVGSAFRLGWWSARVPVRVTTTTTRAVGFKALFFLAVGVALGLLFAPYKGSTTRKGLKRRLRSLSSPSSSPSPSNSTSTSTAPAGAPPAEDPALASKVGFELAHAPRTWHLPQPEVAVLSGRVELVGEVPHARGREELERVAAAVPGVVAVENKLVVAGGPDDAES